MYPAQALPPPVPLAPVPLDEDVVASPPPPVVFEPDDVVLAEPPEPLHAMQVSAATGTTKRRYRVRVTSSYGPERGASKQR